MPSVDYGIRTMGVISNAPGGAGTAFTVNSGQGARFQSGAQVTFARIIEYNTGNVETCFITDVTGDAITVASRNYDGKGALTVAASGYLIEAIDDMGPDHDLAYNAGFFTSSGGGTWPVDSGDVERHSWQRKGYKLDYEFHGVTMSITGTVTQLALFIPIASVANGSPVTGAPQRGRCYGFEAGVFTDMIWFTNAGDDRVRIQKANGANFAVGANTLNIRLQAFGIELT